MLNNFFKKKEELNELQKNMLRTLCFFYETNKELFINEFNNQKEKRELIKKIYEVLDYSNCPSLDNNQETFRNSNIKIYRGISADNQNQLNKYINDLVYGEPFYGGRASIYGTGIYTVIGENSNIAVDYASDGGMNNCGVVMEAIMEKDSKIIESSKINDIRSFLLDRIRKLYSKDIDNYLNILEDDGVLTAILGYDAIFVEEKKYLVILNRSKLIINKNVISDYIEMSENYQRR